MGLALQDRRSGRMTGAEFRLFQLSRPDHERWELIAGAPVMMTPPTIAHNRIAANLDRLLNDALESHDPSRIALQRTGVELGSGDFRPEPDVCVIDAGFAQDQRFVERVYLLAEVVSASDEVLAVPGTQERWIESKRRIYRAHQPCEAVLIIRQDSLEAEVDLRIGNDWQSSTLSGGEAELHLPTFGLQCPLGDLSDGTPLRPRKRRT
ncbi:MAG: Uma2 family endonuclease [Rhodopseudomonas palustris]|uniref:Uma2 family endonuclease n=1 Tax=Rhodopseudomonas palustris TaxID=1076 RepID=A0A933S077_RHOPL|nr:Uma2 family endonuclease [Rhodopseudomonas palustris]